MTRIFPRVTSKTKQLLLGSITLLMLLSSAMVRADTSLCTPGKCVQCNYSDSKGYCAACYKSVLGGTAADLKDGFCEGDSSSISNCLVTTREGANLICKRCDIGY